MLSLPTPLQDAIRSHLNFLELHSSRVVCKRWQDIENIPKVIDDRLLRFHHITRKGFIPPHACTSQVTSLTFCQFWSPLTDDSGSLRFIFHVLQSNQNTLKELRMRYSKDLPENFFIPKLPVLTHLSIGASRSIVVKFLKNAPALKNFTVYEDDDGLIQDSLTSIDISEYPYIAGLVVPNSQFSIQNFSDGSLKRVEFSTLSVADWNDIRCYFEDPKLEIICNFWYDENTVVLISTNQSLKFKYFSVAEDDSLHVAMKFKDAIEKIKRVRMDADLDVKTIIQAASGAYLFQILQFLTNTEMFGDKELLKMALQSGQHA